MTFTPAIRRLTYTMHITSSLGWVGAVIVFIVLALIGLTTADETTTRGVYLVMAPAAWFALVPLAHVSLLSGLALCLGTAWGVFRYYWVVSKLVITIFATGVLLAYMATFREMAGVAADSQIDLGAVRNRSPLVHGVLALNLLLVATWLSIYKPFGAIGRREPKNSDLPILAGLAITTVRWRRPQPSVMIAVGCLVVIFVLLLAHVIGGRQP